MPNNNSLDNILDHIVAISKGQCNINEDVITSELDESKRNILMGLLYLHDDLELGREEIIEANMELEKKIKDRTKKLKAESSKLKILNDELELFAFIAAHDLKSPVLNLSKVFEIMEEDKVINDAGKPIFKMAKRAIGNLVNMISAINSLLAINNSLHLEFDDTSISKGVEYACENLNKQISDSQSIINLNFEAINRIKYPETHLILIIQNLISNSIKYKREDSAPIINISSFTDNGFYGIKLEDNGMGMDLDLYGKKIFLVFERFHVDHAEGAGIGLHIVKKIVENYGGSISIESEVGQGTIFTIYLDKN